MNARDIKPHTDLELAASWIDNHLGLMQWVEISRRVLNEIQTFAELDVGLAAALKRHDIRYNHDWGERESAGLYQLTEDVAQGVQRAIAAGKETPHV